MDREPATVIQDLKDKIISDWSAENVYKVIYNPENMKIDEEATQRHRQTEREKRLKQSSSYEEFEKKWLKLKIDDSLLKFYGSWPEGEMVEPIVRDKKRILPCAAMCDGQYELKDVVVGVPVKLGKDGVEEILEVDLTPDEKEALHKSAAGVKKNIDALKM